MQNFTHDLAVVFGRFNPFHNGHLALINYAKTVAPFQLVLLGSTNVSPNIKNPFPATIRKKMIMKSCGDDGRLTVRYLPDYQYNENEWLSHAQELVQQHVKELEDIAGPGIRVTIVGQYSDESSYYLNEFPQWDLVQYNSGIEFHATDIRKAIFNTEGEDQIRIGMQYVKERVPAATYEVIENFIKMHEFERLQREYQIIQDYKKSWEAAPYPPIFVTVDAVVVCKGHILLVERKSAPGEGLFALPGGFLDQKERIEDGIIRELVEETQIRLHPDNVLKPAIKRIQVFDSPSRSERGRTITHAGLIPISYRKSGLPSVKGADDAEAALWLPLSDVMNMENKIYEDHLDIIRSLIGFA